MWLGQTSNEGVIKESAFNRWLWVGLAVIAGGFVLHHQTRPTQKDPRPIHREGF